MCLPLSDKGDRSRERGGERERDRERGREKERERERDGQRERGRRGRERARGRERERERGTERERERLPAAGLHRRGQTPRRTRRRRATPSAALLLVISIDRPRIFIFTNTLPDYNMLSNDRWNTWVINDNMEMLDYLSLNDDNEIDQKIQRDIHDNERYNDDSPLVQDYDLSPAWVHQPKPLISQVLPPPPEINK